jgi:cystathionine beta-lyase/cystathionine gamma-synthase
MSTENKKGFATRSIHAGVKVDAETRAVKRPLVMSNNYEIPPEGGYEAVTYAYARDLNPNARWLEERLLALEGGEDCVVTSSGVSAINGTFLALLDTGDHIVASEIAYGSVRTMLLEYFPKRFGIHTTLVDTTDPENVEKALTPQTKLIHIETPGNPTTAISDIAAIAEIAKKAGTLLSVDSTWSGLATQHPVQFGADLVMHSLSKYINGHGDAIGGAVLGPKALTDRIRRFAVKDMGGCISPFNAWQIMRGSATLSLRMEKHCQNAMQVAEFLEDHPKVAWVRYPGLTSHPQHLIAKKQMDGFSGMLNFDIKGDVKQRAEVAKRLRLFTYATCLGHEESLIMVYDDYQGHEFFRVSVGLENAEDLIADLDQALDIVKVGE